MKFQVPQFIEVEDKIFGPLTLKQFIYLCGGGGLSVIFYLLLPLYIGLFFIIPIIGFSIALAFYKFNNKPFIFLVESTFKYIFTTHLYIWRKDEKPITMTQEGVRATDIASAFLPKLGNSRLKEMTWTLDTHPDGPTNSDDN